MPLDILPFLTEKLQQTLPGAKAHRKMLPPGRELSIKKEEQSQIMQSGVLLLLFPVEGRLSTCLIKRPANMKHHPGQIGFPGGKVDPIDSSAQETAQRETLEEIGIQPNEYQVIGKLSELYVQVSKFLIHPYVAYAGKCPDFSINPSEVERTLIFPIETFARQPQLNVKPIQTSTGLLDIPYFPFDNECIWGATAMILSEFFEITQPFFLPVQESHSCSACK